MTKDVPRESRTNGVCGASCIFSEGNRRVNGRQGVRLFSVSMGNNRCFGRSSALAPKSRIAIFGARFNGVNLYVYCSFHFPRLTELVISRNTRMVVIPTTFGVAAKPLR